MRTPRRRSDGHTGPLTLLALAAALALVAAGGQSPSRATPTSASSSASSWRGVAGVLPMRPAYTASTSNDVLAGHDFGPDQGHRPDIGLSGIDGRGVTIALLDTGVDRATSFLRGRVSPGIDILGGDPGGLAAR